MGSMAYTSIPQSPVQPPATPISQIPVQMPAISPEEGTLGEEFVSGPVSRQVAVPDVPPVSSPNSFFEEYGEWLDTSFDHPYGLDVIISADGTKVLFKNHTGVIGGSPPFESLVVDLPTDLAGATFEGIVAGRYRSSDERLSGDLTIVFRNAALDNNVLGYLFKVDFEDSLPLVDIDDQLIKNNVLYAAGTCAVGVGCTQTMVGRFFENGSIGGQIEAGDFEGLFGAQ